MSERKDNARHIVLVGTYKGSQLTDWRGWYNYPISDKDKITEADAAKITELWLFKGTKEERRYKAEFIGIKTREELIGEYGYPAKGKAHSSKYLLFKTALKYRHKSEPVEDAERVIVRVKDFATSPKVAKQLKAYLESPDRNNPDLAKRLPSIITRLRPDQLRVCEVAYQMSFWDLPELSSLKPDVPFPPPEHPRFTFIDLFAGIGGFRLAMQGIGGKCVFSSEWDKNAQQTYENNYGDVPYGDIRPQETKDCIPLNFDVLCAGFPCQPFSLAGVSARNAAHRAHGFKDETQGTLFFDVLQIIRQRRPLVVFLENVRNLVNHDKGRTFDVIRRSIENEGYSFAFKLIDASPLVPQKRVRCYMVCVRDGKRFDFPEITGKPLPLKSILEDNVSPSLTISDNLWAGHQRRTRNNLARGTGFTAFTANPDEPAHTLVARYYKDGKECLIPQNGKNPRLLTPRECARLQGFPEEFVLPSSRSVAYKQMGNSVAVPVLRRIAECIDNQILKGVYHGI